MTWAFVGLLFGIGFMAAAVLAVAGVIVRGSLIGVLGARAEEREHIARGWEGTD